jgi:DNA-binding NtrC family response regulator
MPSDSPAAIDKTETLPLKSYLRDIETRYLRETVARCGGDKVKAAQTLNISLATLYRKLDSPSQPPEDTPS